MLKLRVRFTLWVEAHKKQVCGKQLAFLACQRQSRHAGRHMYQDRRKELYAAWT